MKASLPESWTIAPTLGEICPKPQYALAPGRAC